MECSIDLGRWAMILRYQAGEPLMLHGPAAPWFAVAVGYLLFGVEGMELPALGPLGPA